MCWGLLSQRADKTAANRLLSRKFTPCTMRESFNHLLFIIDASKPRYCVGMNCELISDSVTLKTNHQTLPLFNGFIQLTLKIALFFSDIFKGLTLSDDCNLLNKKKKKNNVECEKYKFGAIEIRRQLR